MKAIKQYFLWAEYKSLSKRVEAVDAHIEYMSNILSDYRSEMNAIKIRLQVLAKEIEDALKESK